MVNTVVITTVNIALWHKVCFIKKKWLKFKKNTHEEWGKMPEVKERWEVSFVCSITAEQ